MPAAHTTMHDSELEQQQAYKPSHAPATDRTLQRASASWDERFASAWPHASSLPSPALSASSSSSSSSASVGTLSDSECESEPSTSTALTTPPASPEALRSSTWGKRSRPVHDPCAAWYPDRFTLRLAFTPPGRSRTVSASAACSGDADDDDELPPAFFPSQRISFAPILRILEEGGMPFDMLGGMQLGVTGVVEALDGRGKVIANRMVADFCTDLASGLKIWKRDADQARDDGDEMLPAGTYRLPLSMKIPNSERLPPSSESKYYRVRYTMSIALFSNEHSADGRPRRLKVFSLPFHVLPSTLPSKAPELPVLKHETGKGFLNSLWGRATGYQHVYPSLPTSHFSPGSQASVPVTLRIVDRPMEASDIYVRLAVLRRTYLRQKSDKSLMDALQEIHDPLCTGVPVQSTYPEEVLMDPFCVEDEEIVSRWGWVPYWARPGADPRERAEVAIRDIALPLASDLGEDGAATGWRHGYSCALDLEPSEMPSLTHGDCSWFSPAFRSRAPVPREYDQHLHVSMRFYLSIEIGFTEPDRGNLADELRDLKTRHPDMEIPRENSFTRPRAPALSPTSGASMTNPFASSSKLRRSKQAPPARAFPGHLRELMVPITIGSVAEPSMACLLGTQSASQRADRAAREDRGEQTSTTEGEGAEGAWICPPPKYDEALKSAPAYNFA